MKINKYLSFDISIHKTLYYINKYSSDSFLSYENLLDILQDNWLSTGYQSSYEESLFKSYATTAIKIYSINPLDKGYDIVLLDKFITDTDGSKLRYTKIDKLHFLSSGELELIDYKSGKYIPPINEAFSISNIFFTVNSINKKLGVYPDIFSLYYLRHGIKLSAFINLNTISTINNFTEKNVQLKCNKIYILSDSNIEKSINLISNPTSKLSYS